MRSGVGGGGGGNASECRQNGLPSVYVQRNDRSWLTSPHVTVQGGDLHRAIRNDAMNGMHEFDWCVVAEMRCGSAPPL